MARLVHDLPPGRMLLGFPEPHERHVEHAGGDILPLRDFHPEPGRIRSCRQFGSPVPHAGGGAGSGGNSDGDLFEHAQLPTQRGRALPPEFFSDLLQGARERGPRGRADFILTACIGSPRRRADGGGFRRGGKAVNPALTYLCNPVMGDTGSGLYVPEAIADVMRDRLLPMADIATPNLFELSWLTERKVATTWTWKRHDRFCALRQS
ncbi:bifunctional hydroxymethylpyrimidine kinase/phosphomethylpyrimidine kinase [Sinorhizobium meliloti]|uniref:bifunctional hydroxymethylpyrimidine kinase/phosphomethylpyrimidine kinase n=1 Tax=Rhizobium meliloti TaxID=382 RepID=UPI001F2B6A0D|nr:bifunctional hydroxymethylpyrimidine kinase/phosphomethylpyrimidine kinase [Sinorhizobium meliloti]